MLMSLMAATALRVCACCEKRMRRHIPFYDSRNYVLMVFLCRVLVGVESVLDEHRRTNKDREGKMSN